MGQRVDELEATERKCQDRFYAAVGVAGQWMLGHGQDHDRNVQPGIPYPLYQLGALDLALQEQIHHDHVRPELVHRLKDLRTVAEHFEQLHMRLHAQQVAHVLTYLGHVFGDE